MKETIYIRLDPELKRRIEAMAEAEGVSVNQWAVDCFESCLDQPINKAPEPPINKAPEPPNDWMRSELDSAIRTAVLRERNECLSYFKKLLTGKAFDAMLEGARAVGAGAGELPDWLQSQARTGKELMAE